MNYRKLSKEELVPLEKEFIDFLVVNGITAPDWEKLKSQEVDKAEQMVELFSEVVFEGIFRKTSFLAIKTKRFIHAYQCLRDKIILVGVESNSENVDLSNNLDFQNYSIENKENLSLFMTEKKYALKREYEMFDMTEKGCQISDGELFKQLSLAYIENKKNG